ncbi:MAG: universal stress protein [Thermodesulfobacteriota bacterium]
MDTEYREDMVETLPTTRKNPLERHLLVTVSEDTAHQSGLRFVGNFLHDRETLRVTLFYVAPLPPGAYDKHDFVAVEHANLTDRSAEQRGRHALDRAAKALAGMGLPKGHIKTRFKYREYSTAQDILTEAHRGLYDAVVLGHRGISSLEQFWSPSVGRTLIDSSFTTPLWVCRRPDYSRKHVLLCLDGSGPSLCAADHAGFILAREPEHRLTLFTVQTPTQEDEAGTGHIFGLARKTLLDNGVPAERIRTKAVSSPEPGAAILEEVREGRYAAVGMGRTGRGRGFLKRIFLGSVGATVFNGLEGAALWICQ